MEQINIKKEILYWCKTVMVVVAFSILFTVFIFQPYAVSGSSMEPTFNGHDPEDYDKPGDRVFIFKTPYLLGVEPDYGDMVIVDSNINKDRTLIDDFLDNPIIRTVVNSNEDKNRYWIKRVIGKQGDQLEFIEGKVYRNGEELEESYIKETMMFPFESIVVTENHVFVMGDNRNGSFDSRHIGPLPIDHLIGKVSMRYYPLNKISIY
jgi:signal peptidase I